MRLVWIFNIVSPSSKDQVHDTSVLSATFVSLFSHRCLQGTSAEAGTDFLTLMSVTITSLSKPFVAVNARKRLFTWVGSEMISEIAKLRELVRAILTFKELINSVGSLISHEHLHVATFTDRFRGFNLWCCNSSWLLCLGRWFRLTARLLNGMIHDVLKNTIIRIRILLLKMLIV